MREKFSLVKCLKSMGMTIAGGGAAVIAALALAPENKYPAMIQKPAIAREAELVDAPIEPRAQEPVSCACGNCGDDSKLETKVRNSPNFNTSPDRTYEMIVLHTTEGAGEGALEWLTTPGVNGSCHYLVMENGDIYSLVPEDKVAWHCAPHGGKTFNLRSIGIEFAGYHDKPLTPEQYSAGKKLIYNIQERYNLQEKDIKAHSDLNPGRKFDPGKENFEELLK